MVIGCVRNIGIFRNSKSPLLESVRWLKNTAFSSPITISWWHRLETHGTKLAWSTVSAGFLAVWWKSPAPLWWPWTTMHPPNERCPEFWSGIVTIQTSHQSKDAFVLQHPICNPCVLQICLGAHFRQESRAHHIVHHVWNLGFNKLLVVVLLKRDDGVENFLQEVQKSGVAAQNVGHLVCKLAGLNHSASRIAILSSRTMKTTWMRC